LYVLVTLEAFAKGKEEYVAKTIEEYLKEKGLRVQVEKDWESPSGRLLVKVSDSALWRVCELLRSRHEISHIIPFQALNLQYDVNVIGERAAQLLEELMRSMGRGSFMVITKKIHGRARVDKSSPEISREVGAVIKSRLDVPVDLEKPDYVVYVQIGSRIALGVAPSRIVFKERRALPKEFFRDVVIVFERPKMKYEIMDMIRLCAALNVELRIVGDENVRKKVSEVLNIMKGAGMRANVIVYDELDDALRGLVPVALTRYGELNEEDLLKMKLKGRIGLMIGNEYEGLSLKARERARYRIRLGPEVGLSMRGSTAAAYVLGFLSCLKLNKVVSIESKMDDEQHLVRRDERGTMD